MPSGPARVLILCTGNSCRSQMAQGFLRATFPSLEVHSAGTAPASSVHPVAIAVMKEVGIDIAGGVPKDVRQYAHERFDYVITVCDEAREVCPVFPGGGGVRLHMGFPDPATVNGTPGEIHQVFRQVRDDIRARLGGYFQSRFTGAS